MSEIQDLKAMVGEEFGPAEWMRIDQARINAFADVTEDRQFIHVDPERAAQTPFGGTIAHGFLTLSLLSHFADQVRLPLQDYGMALNYGFDKVRFIAPVPEGAEIRGRFTLAGVEDKSPGQHIIRLDALVEIREARKPALSAEWLALLFAS